MKRKAGVIASLVLTCFLAAPIALDYGLARAAEEEEEVAEKPGKKPKIPPPYTFEQIEKDEDGKLSSGKVTFDHNIHLGKAEKYKYDPKYEKKAKEAKCATCHKGKGPAKLFQTKNGKTPDMTMKAYLEGKRCGKCHDGEDSFKIHPVKEKEKQKETCEKCHKEEKKT